MKHLFTVLFGILMAASASAQNRGQVATLQGVIDFETQWTVTCAAIGCPPSRPYTQAVLTTVGAVSERITLVPVQSLQDQTGEPSSITYGNLRITRGLAVRVTGLYRPEYKMMMTVTRLDVLGQQLTALAEISSLAIPYSHNQGTQMPGWKITIQADGTVVKTIYAGQAAGQSKNVRKLSVAEVRMIQSLLQQAQQGTIQAPDMSQPVCLAMPSHNSKIAGLNGQVLLLEGAFPCGRVTKNSSPAAARLVDYLQKLAQAVNARN